MFKSTKYYHDLYFKLNKIETRNSLKKVLINYKNNRVIFREDKGIYCDVQSHEKK